MTEPPRMRRGELITLVATVGWSVGSFLPLWRAPELAGVSVFGWLMAVLMVLSPLLALAALRRGSGQS